MTDSNNLSRSVRHGRSPGTISSGLLCGVQADGAEDWRRLVALYAPLVSYWCQRGGLQSNDADDVTQEVFRTVALRITNFRRDRPGDTFRGWLKQITRNKLGDFYRAAHRRPQPLGGTQGQRRAADIAYGSAEPASSTETQPAEQSLFQLCALEMIRCEFEPSTWQAFVMTVVNGMRPKDVAEELGLSVNSVYLAKSRILRRARQELAET